MVYISPKYHWFLVVIKKKLDIEILDKVFRTLDLQLCKNLETSTLSNLSNVEHLFDSQESILNTFPNIFKNRKAFRKPLSFFRNVYSRTKIFTYNLRQQEHL